jgi:hypothetical protein
MNVLYISPLAKFQIAFKYYLGNSQLTFVDLPIEDDSLSHHFEAYHSCMLGIALYPGLVVLQSPGLISAFERILFP